MNRVMRNTIIKTIVLVSFFACTTFVFAQAPLRILHITNPSNNNGIQIGDILNRTIAVEVGASYNLPKTSLPIKGERRDGIELTDISVTSKQSGERTVFTISLSYQVFDTADKPVLMQLPAEQLPLTGGNEATSIDMPAWQFWYSPLVPEGVMEAKSYLLPQSKPTLLNLETHQTRLWISLGLLVIGAIGLIYANANTAWLPYMNGAFAQAYRQIKKTKDSQVGNKQAFMLIHQAFNKTYGANLFASDLPQFFIAHPTFLTMQSEIERFFHESNASLFGAQATLESGYLNRLKIFCKQLRDCERGVK
jgi:mxaA protein